MSDRIFAVLWLLLCAGMAAVGWGISTEFAYEPVGPRAYPLLILALMAVCSAWLLFKPGEAVDWPRGALLKKVAVMIVAVLLYALIFESAGFAVATALLTVAIGRLFDGKWLHCAVGGVVMGVALFYFFDRLLDVPLPGGFLLG